MRTFISIELPEDIKKEIFDEYKKISNYGFVVGNFVEKNNLHLTLKFLGDISEEEINKVKEKLSKIKFEKFEIKTGEIGFFPSDKYVKVIWISLDSDNIKKLKDEIETSLFELGITKEEREFSSHVTIARIKKIKDNEKFLEEIKKLHLRKKKFFVEKISLIKSELIQQGPIYKILEEFPLE